jgi:two-component system sensor histidine kinase HupT/HoxJ
VISDTTAIIFLVALIALAAFATWLLRYRSTLLLPKIYLMVALCYAIWVMALLVMKFTPPEDTSALFMLDSLTYVGVANIPVLCLLIALAFVNNWEKLPKKFLWLFLIPLITNGLVWTNPLYHMYYVNFSVVRSQIVFGPYIYISGGYNYACMIISIFLILKFIIRSPAKLYIQQGVLYIIGVLIPLVVSIMATAGYGDMSIAATPLSFVFTLIFHGIDIYQLHLLDIQPIATQHILDGISDCYLVLSDNGLVMSMNQPFRAMFGTRYNIAENKFLIDSVQTDSREEKTPVYYILTAVETCGDRKTGVSYEQAVTINGEDGVRRYYYIAEITPLFVSDKLTGYVCIFKDITALKNSLQQLENSRTRMMEQERLAFLGQMVGGLAHNLKTPIMSISGCASAMENLVIESRQSLGDPDVTDDDYREIYGEMDSWVARIRDSCAYMSDIITAIKGQAAHASATEEGTFSVDELLKRVALLMRHELLSNQCQLMSESNVQGDIILNGDVNNLIQVLNNLISNAVYAQKQKGGGQIVLGVEKDEENLNIYVKDTGPGVEPRVRDRLFREMITSKGTQGTGLGLYISNAVVRGKFGGTMWLKDNPGGGSIFGLSIPLENVTFAPKKEEGKEDDAQ